jgi:arylsulfatase A-like enzyme
MSDDHAYQAISSYGGPLAELAPTPNIDRIADEGMRFTGCMVTNSICGPSRATILTGKYSHKNGSVDNTNGTKFDFSQLTLTKVLQQAGYKTAMIWKGKGGWSTLYGHDATQGTSPCMGPGAK